MNKTPTLADGLTLHVLTERRRVVIHDHHGETVAKFYPTVSLERATAHAQLFLDAMKLVDLFEANGGQQLPE